MDYLSRTIVALDGISTPMAIEIMDHWKDTVYGFKLNHTIYTEIIPTNWNIFVDYKLADIPNTMQKVIESLIDDGASMVTITMNTAQSHIEALAKYADKIKLLGVTLLTSYDNDDIIGIYGENSFDRIWNRSIQLMKDNGFYGAIVAPQDIVGVKRRMQDRSLKILSPGIRLVRPIETDDQVRVGTPRKTLQLGADYLIMGRSFFNHLEEHKENIPKTIPIYQGGHGVHDVLDELQRQGNALNAEPDLHNENTAK